VCAVVDTLIYTIAIGAFWAFSKSFIDAVESVRSCYELHVPCAGRSISKFYPLCRLLQSS
jgi:hypothetical protein